MKRNIIVNNLLPREKVKEYGISSLNNVELLSLIIKSAHKSCNVFEVAENIIKKANGFDNILSLSYEELISIKGVKDAKAMELLAILEIYKRLSKPSMIKDDLMKDPDKIIEWLRFNVAFSNQEEFLVVYLNCKCVIIKHEILFKGSKSCSVVAIDEILRRALLLKASFIVVAHNHPSGEARPSIADKELTRKLLEASRMMTVPLLDHIIIGKNNHYSFAKEGLIIG